MAVSTGSFKSRVQRAARNLLPCLGHLSPTEAKGTEGFDVLLGTALSGVNSQGGAGRDPSEDKGHNPGNRTQAWEEEPGLLPALLL